MTDNNHEWEMFMIDNSHASEFFIKLTMTKS